MSLSTLVRLALVGSRSDRVRIALTGLGAAIGTVTLLCAATVAAVPSSTDAAGYTDELLNNGALRSGVVLALLVLAVPTLTLVAQCTRVGAPARDERLAAVGLAGATPGQVARIVITETCLASLPGVAAGFAAYLTGRALLDAPDARGVRPLPTDVLPSALSLVAVAIAVPLLVAVLTAVTLRRVVATPLGVVRKARPARPRALPGWLILAGLGACALVEPVYRWFARQPRTDDAPALVIGGLVVVGILLVAAGVVTGTAWITYTCGRMMVRYARGPAALLAGRRMTADPWSGSRSFAALLVALLIGSAAAGLGAYTVASVAADEENTRRFAELLGETYEGAGTSLYERGYDLVGYGGLVALVIAAAGLLVALADTLLAQRRTFASLVAAGTPRKVLARAVVWQSLTPVVPSVAPAVLAGVLMPRLAVPSGQDTAPMGTWRCTPLPGDPSDACADPSYAEAHSVQVTADKVTAVVEVPWEQLGLLSATALAAVVLVTVLGLCFLRVSTQPGWWRTA
ncbi:hypothetical protein [Streptomyces sp. NPDC126514]|uniref:hypothetical protein n=1 Tax=Streptomyces sp. NPDC126514 TaxID=3155210 RepID=UPI00331A80A9